MKRITLFLMAAVLAMTTGLTAQETCVADPTKLYFTTNAGWSQSEWYPIIDIDAEKLTPEATGLAAHNGANGSATASTFSTGVFKTPVYNVDEQMNPVETAVKWPVHFYMACLTNSFYNSSYTKVNELGTNPSGGATDQCYFNNNGIIISPIWNKKGFIELSRLASEVANTPPSRHGYIVINDLPQVERIQWSFSSTGWKRGVKLDIKHGEGDWEPLRWIPSDIANSLGSFTEQGYAFEELINKQEDPTSKISLRWRIWDGDSIHENVTKTDGSKYTTTMTPYAQRQVARIHQIKIFSGVVPTEAPSAVRNPSDFFLHIYRSGDNIAISEVAKVEVFAINGKKMYSGTTNLINARNFDKGVYLIKATGVDGRVQNQKILL
jgi:hypothetical protein